MKNSCSLKYQFFAVKPSEKIQTGNS